jgi:hypothetical protein
MVPINTEGHQMHFSLPLLPVLPVSFEPQTHDPQDVDWRAGDSGGLYGVRQDAVQ